MKKYNYVIEYLGDELSTGEISTSKDAHEVQKEILDRVEVAVVEREIN